MNPELVNKNHVLQAITEYDRLGRDDFLKKYGFGKSRQYLLLHKEKTYDSKPIFGVAHGFATGDFLTAKDFSGGVAAAAGYLQNIGFEIDDALTTEPDGVDRNYWALFANPRIYKIQDAINEHSDDLWVTKGRQISLGDRVLIWKGTGDDGWRGVVAFGDVINDPTVTIDRENPYWKNPTDGLSPEERVRVSYVTVPSLPLRYGSAQWDVLNELSISRARGGTVFKVETETWKKLISSAGGWPSETITPSAQSNVRNQKWSREEVILALDVYMRYGLIGEKHPELQNLSNTLRKRVDLTKVTSPDKYRNLNGCKMKLANLARLDPGYEGVGLKGGGQLEEEIWNEFAGDQERLSILAAQLRSDRNTYSKPADDDRLGKSAIKDSYSPNYWWVNQNQTFKEEFSGGYLWSPKTNSNGAKNQFYDNMTLVRSGDVVMSFADRYIKAIGIATETASTRPKPKQFGDNWNHADEEGWYVPVDYTELQNPILPREHMDVLGPLQPSKYYPLQRNGKGLQGVYLASLPAEMWKALVELLSGQVEPLRQSIGIDAFTENLNDRHEEELINRDDIGETERTHLAKSRRGQGLFKKRVSERESQCRVTGVTDLHHLRASHIKPWKDSTDYEKLDGDNGLLLAPHVDHLFDRGFVSFTRQGKVLVSAKLDSSILTSWQVDPSKNVGDFSSEQDQYLDYHRSEIFKK